MIVLFRSYHDLRKADEEINRLGEEENYKLWIGKDYTNFIFKDFVDLNEPFTGKVEELLYR